MQGVTLKILLALGDSKTAAYYVPESVLGAQAVGGGREGFFSQSSPRGGEALSSRKGCCPCKHLTWSVEALRGSSHQV